MPTSKTEIERKAKIFGRNGEKTPTIKRILSSPVQLPGKTRSYPTIHNNGVFVQHV